MSNHRRFNLIMIASYMLAIFIAAMDLYIWRPW